MAASPSPNGTGRLAQYPARPLHRIRRDQPKSRRLGGDKTLEIRLEPDVASIGTAVVSAGRYEQDLGEVSVSIDVLPPELVNQGAPTSADQSLSRTPGVTIVDSEPQIRGGSGYSFGAGSRVAVLLDGLPVLSGDAGRPTWGFLPLENLEQVEVVKGASSVLYGSSALSGVIQFRTAYGPGTLHPHLRPTRRPQRPGQRPEVLEPPPHAEQHLLVAHPPTGQWGWHQLRGTVARQ